MVVALLVALASACSSPCPVLADPGLGARHPAAAATGAQARYPLSSYVARADYPAAALRNREQGRVGFALGIGADGRVNACRITASSGSAALDGTTCRIMRSRPRYTPARDARGVAVPDVDVGEISWTLPAD
jgi:protein TonB